MVASATKPEFKTDFNLQDLFEPPSFKENFFNCLLRIGFWRWSPVSLMKLPGFRIVARYDDVQEVLSRDDVFQMGIAEKMKLLTRGPNFILGMEDGNEYQRVRGQLMQAFRRDDAEFIRSLCAKESSKIVRNARGRRLDAIQDLITRVPTTVCEEYFGVTLNDDNRLAFPHWTFAMSHFLFGDWRDDPKYRRAAIAGAERVRAVIDAAIDSARANGSAGRDTIIKRLICMQEEGAQDLSNDVIRSCMMGMVSGFIPTSTLAAGHVLEYLLRNETPKLLRNETPPKAQAHEAALHGDDEELRRVLAEAARFEPISVGRFRYCAEDTALAVGTSRETEIKRGEKLLVSMRSAMADKRRVKSPRAFKTDRDPTDYMLFGHGLHFCLCVHIAEPQVTQTLKPLLAKRGLRRANGRAGRLSRIGNFPQHLIVEF